MPLWIPPLIAVAIYPGLLVLFDQAINGYHESGSPLMAVYAALTMLLAGSVPVLAARALLVMRHDAGPVLTRGMLYLMVGTPSLFLLSYRFIRMTGVGQFGLIVTWASAWLAVGLMLYASNGRGRGTRATPDRPATWVRVVHGATALCLLLGFLLAHVANHNLALWSVELHGVVLRWLRLWYRSDWVEPVLFALLLVMIGTGVPMVLRYSRQRMDAFRVVQAATGAYVGIFICSHVVATLSGRRAGVDTDWFFAAGPDSLLAGASMISRLIPHYVFGTFCLILHVACGLRVVLLQHGVPMLIGNRALYGLAGAGLIVTVTIAAALLGFHVKATG
jgi:hypothetical protein